LKKKRASKSKAVDQQLGRLAASVGAGLSMGFAEEVSDVGSLTGHGKRLLRGIVCGLVTTAGGIGHTFLIRSFRTATAIAVVVVPIELLLITEFESGIRTPPFSASLFK
jgi:erythrin-vacuolar iron transport family protein